MHIASFASLSVLVVCVVAACGREQPPPASAVAAPVTGTEPASPDKRDYPVFPDADAGADPAVAAELGGRGFTGEGWETNVDFDFIGDPRAVKGGTLRDYQLSFPGTLRIHGPEADTVLNSMIGSMLYEPLLTIHPTTLDFIPVLATHWQISGAGSTYRFRIDPNARWSDGAPVTADDVVASWSLYMDPSLQSPTLQLTYGKFEKPVAESKYIVSVKSLVQNWRNFMYFSSSMLILPAHVLKEVDGAKYLADYNFKFLPGTGAYRVDEAEIRKGQSITIRRRMDYWAANARRNVGLNNFDEVRETVVRDQNLVFEMFKKGDIDYYFVNISREWIEELDFDRVQRGLIQKRKVFNDTPSGTSGIAFNMRREPFSDIRVRQALALLQNRQLFIERLFFNEYLPLNSYHGGIYENANNPKNEYDPQAALALLAEAGWSSRDARGRLVRNGQPLTIELLYSQQSSERYLTLYQQDLERVGIGLNLRLVTPETAFALMMDRNFDATEVAWTGLVFPNPETAFASALADERNNPNISGFKDARVDELLAAYDRELDQHKRVAMIQEIDGILARSHQYALAWDAPFHRIAYWNKFGQPEGYFSRIGDHRDLPTMWWIDPARDAELRRAVADNSVTLDVGETEVRYWQNFDERQQAAAAAE